MYVVVFFFVGEAKLGKLCKNCGNSASRDCGTYKVCLKEKTSRKIMMRSSGISIEHLVLVIQMIFIGGYLGD